MNQIVGNPVLLRIGKRNLLVGYVSMLEWQIYSQLVKVDEAEAMMELIYYSLQRGNNMTKKDVDVFLKKTAKKHPGLLAEIVETICSLSLPEIKKKEGEGEGSDDGSNIKTVYRLLAKENNWTSGQVGKLSPAQIFLYVTGGEDCTGVKKMSPAEYAAYRQKRGL